MAANTTGPIWELVPTCGVPKQFTSADTTAKKTIVTGDTDGTRIDSIMCSSNDTAAINLAFYLNDGSTDWYIGNVVVPLSSGYLAIARVDAITTLAPLLGYLTVPSGYTLKCNCVATMTAAKVLDVVPMGGDYS
jgi:hypothetical protein